MVTATPSRHRFTVEEFEALGRLEEFWDGPRLELVEGEIVEMAPIGPDHGSCVLRLNTWFSARLGDRALVSVQSALRLGDLSEPQPDLMLLVPPLQRYRHRHPTAEDVLLLVEVANTSLAFDRGTKAALYARYGVPEIWIVDLAGGAIEVLTEPSPAGYGVVERRGRGEVVAPAAFADVALAVDDVLG